VERAARRSRLRPQRGLLRLSYHRRGPPSWYFAEKILTSKPALEGERVQVTVLFADTKGSMGLLAGRHPREARQLVWMGR
jgi:hypothetical protein